MPEMHLPLLEDIAVIGARLSKHGALDYEANLDRIVMAMLKEVMDYRVTAFKLLLASHSLNQEDTSIQTRTSIVFRRNQNRVRRSLDKWIEDAKDTDKWGTLQYRDDQNAFPSRSFSFSINEKFGKLRHVAHPHLRDMRALTMK